MSSKKASNSRQDGGPQKTRREFNGDLAAISGGYYILNHSTDHDDEESFWDFLPWVGDDDSETVEAGLWKEENGVLVPVDEQPIHIAEGTIDSFNADGTTIKLADIEDLTTTHALKQLEVDHDARSRGRRSGQSWDNFEDLSQWSIQLGNLSADTSTVYSGTQSAHMTAGSDSEALIYKSLNGADLSNKTISAALYIPEGDTASGSIRVTYITSGDRSNLTMTLNEQLYEGGWFRADFGLPPNPDSGTPDLTSVDELRIRYADTDADLYIDDLRTHRPLEEPTVIIRWDDQDDSMYSTGYPIMDEYNMPGFAAVQSEHVGSTGKTTLSELKELQDSGWTVGSHSTDSQELTSVSLDEAETKLRESKRWLLDNGFYRGADYFVPPKGTTTPDLQDKIAKYYRASFIMHKGAVGNVSAPLNLHSFLGDNRTDVENLLDHIVNPKYPHNLLVLTYHTVGEGSRITESDFRAIIDKIASLDIRVKTPDEVFGGPARERTSPSRDSGSATASGDGAATTFTIPHNLGMTPSDPDVWPESADAAGDFYISAKGPTSVDVTYLSAPASGTNNLTWGYAFERY